MRIQHIAFDQLGPKLKSIIQEKENVKTEKEQQENGSEINFFLYFP